MRKRGAEHRRERQIAAAAGNGMQARGRIPSVAEDCRPQCGMGLVRVDAALIVAVEETAEVAGIHRLGENALLLVVQAVRSPR